MQSARSNCGVAGKQAMGKQHTEQENPSKDRLSYDAALCTAVTGGFEEEIVSGLICSGMILSQRSSGEL